jgi:hypothetical protein
MSPLGPIIVANQLEVVFWKKLQSLVWTIVFYVNLQVQIK